MRNPEKTEKIKLARKNVSLITGGVSLSCKKAVRSKGNGEVWWYMSSFSTFEISVFV